MRVIKTLNSVYEVESTADGDKIRRSEPDVFGHHHLADGEWQQLTGIYPSSYEGRYIIGLASGCAIVTSPVISDSEEVSA